jgi:hypothetical protein
MGIFPSTKSQQPTPAAVKRRSGQLDFSNLGPLKTSGTVGFSAFRDADSEPARHRKTRKRSNGGAADAMNEDSDEDDDQEEMLGRMEETDDKDVKSKRLTPEDAQFSGELADGVNRIRVE